MMALLWYCGFDTVNNTVRCRVTNNFVEIAHIQQSNNSIKAGSLHCEPLKAVQVNHAPPLAAQLGLPPRPWGEGWGEGNGHVEFLGGSIIAMSVGLVACGLLGADSLVVDRVGQSLHSVKPKHHHEMVDFVGAGHARDGVH